MRLPCPLYSKLCSQRLNIYSRCLNICPHSLNIRSQGLNTDSVTGGLQE